jgi:hypothetical protein
VYRVRLTLDLSAAVAVPVDAGESTCLTGLHD